MYLLLSYFDSSLLNHPATPLVPRLVNIAATRVGCAHTLIVSASPLLLESRCIEWLVPLTLRTTLA